MAALTVLLSTSYNVPLSASKLHFPRAPGAVVQADGESKLEQTTIPAAEPSRKRFDGQVTVVSLLIALPLLALLVFEQGRVIDAQRLLIRQLSSDSQQLNAIRVQELQKRSGQAHAPAATPKADAPQQPRSGQQPSMTPEKKNPKRHQGRQASPPPPQEYPATRAVPVRKSA